MTWRETQDRTARARARHLNPWHQPLPSPGHLSKQEMQEMLREAVINTAEMTTDENS